MSDVYKALADRTRRVIMDELAARDQQTLFEICARLAMEHQLTPSRQAVSQHLAVLEEAGLVITRREGRYKFHSLDVSPLRAIEARWLTKRPARKVRTTCESTSAASSSTTRTRRSPSTPKLSVS